MNRRDLFKFLPAVIATPELAEILMPRKTIILPPKGGWPVGATPFSRPLQAGLRVRGTLVEFEMVLFGAEGPIRTIETYHLSDGGKLTVRRSNSTPKGMRQLQELVSTRRGYHELHIVDFDSYEHTPPPPSISWKILIRGSL